MVCNKSQKYDVRYELGRRESLELVGSAPWMGNQQSPAMHGYIWAASFHHYLSGSGISKGKHLEQDPSEMNSQH
jgi:hypothetical protein